MSLLTKVGTFSAATSTGNQAVGNIGFAPKAIFFWLPGGTTDSTFLTTFNIVAYGVTTGASNSYSVGMLTNGSSTWEKIEAKAIVQTSTSTGGYIRQADLYSLDSDGFTLNWTGARSDTTYGIINYLALGGTDLTGAKVVPWATASSTGNQAITGVGFVPDAVIHIHGGPEATGTLWVDKSGSGFGLGVMTKGGDQWGVTQQAFFRHQVTNKTLSMITGSSVVKQASFVSMDSDGFTVNHDIASTAANVISLCLKGPTVTAGHFVKTTGSAPASQSITGAGFAPKAVLLASAQDIVQTSPSAKGAVGVGASDGTNKMASAGFISSGSAHSVISKNSKAFIVGDSAASTINAEANMTSLDSDGFTLNWTTNSATATSLAYLAFGDAAPSGSPQPLAGSSAGTSTATATRLSLRQPLAGTSTGVSAASATRLRLSHPLAGSAAGTSTASATRLRLSQPLTATSTATSTATATRLRLSHPLTGSSASTSSATASRLTLTHPLTGTSTATSTATASRIVESHPLAGLSAATSTATADLGRIPGTHALSGVVASMSTASASRLSLAQPLVGNAASQSTATARRIRLNQPLAGTSNAVSFAAGLRISLAHALTGTSAGTSSATADRIVMEHPLDGVVAGTSDAYGDLTTFVPITHMVGFAADARPSAFVANARPSSFVAARPATTFAAGEPS